MDIVGENSGDVAMTATAISITGPNAADFSATLVPVQFESPACTLTVNPSTFCQFEVTFSPAANATGTRTATLLLTDSAGGSPQSFPLSGTVIGSANLFVSPTSAALGPVAIGAPPPIPFTNFTLTNPTASAETVSALTISGDTTDFSVTNGTCPSLPPFAIAANSSCVVRVQFSAAVGPSGLRMATLAVTTNPSIAGIPTVSITAEAVTTMDPALFKNEYTRISLCLRC